MGSPALRQETLSVSLSLRFRLPFLQKAKQYYDFGEDEEFQCYTGLELEGFQFITCRPDGTWTQPQGRCLSECCWTDCDELLAVSPSSAPPPPGRVCLPPDLPEDMRLQPSRDEYRPGDVVGLDCVQRGLFPQPVSSFTCGPGLTWEPPPPADLRCSDGTAAPPPLLSGDVSVDQRCGPSVSCCRGAVCPGRWVCCWPEAAGVRVCVRDAPELPVRTCPSSTSGHFCSFDVCVFAGPSQRPSASSTQTSAWLCPCPSAPSMPAVAMAIRSSSSARGCVIQTTPPNWSGPNSELKCPQRALSSKAVVWTPATSGRPALVRNLSGEHLFPDVHLTFPQKPH